MVPEIPPSSRLGSNPFTSSQPFGAGPVFGASAPWWAGVNPSVTSPSDPFGDVCDEADCQSAIERLYFFLDGELTLDRRTAVQVHLEACPSCFGAFGFEAELRSVVQRGVVDVVPENLLIRIRAALASELLNSPELLNTPPFPE